MAFPQSTSGLRAWGLLCGPLTLPALCSTGCQACPSHHTAGSCLCSPAHLAVSAPSPLPHPLPSSSHPHQKVLSEKLPSGPPGSAALSGSPGPGAATPSAQIMLCRDFPCLPAPLLGLELQWGGILCGAPCLLPLWEPVRAWPRMGAKGISMEERLEDQQGWDPGPGPPLSQPGHGRPRDGKHKGSIHFVPQHRRPQPGHFNRSQNLSMFPMWMRKQPAALQS